MRHQYTFSSDVDYEAVDRLLDQLEAAVEDRENEGRQATVFLTTPGGDVSAALGAYDRIRYLERREGLCLTIVATGEVMSSGLLLLQATTHKRLSLPNTLFMYHEPHQLGWGGQDERVRPSEVASRQRLHETTLEMMVEVLAASTRDISRGDWRSRLSQPGETYFRAQQAKSWGLIDDIIR